ncbi:MAG: hypothetical protein IKA37_01530 [Spirochaetales bacterium]|nr:hypothetical protein [Spirochaetales bacterium]
MNKLRYTFIFLILISLFPCHGLLADEKTNNITENVTETVSTSTTENESEENHVNIKPQKKENIFIQIMKWLGFIILIAVIAVCIVLLLYYLGDCYFEPWEVAVAIIYFILAIVLKVGFGIGFFWSAIMPIFIISSIFLLIYLIVEIIPVVWEAWGEWLDERERKREQERKIIEAKKQKQLALEQIQEEAAMEKKANEDAMRKSEVERNIDELSDYIDMLGVSIQKKELPDVQVVSVLYKILISILDSKPYITKEGLCKICDDNDVFIKHVLEKCSELENFSGSLLETRMLQVKAKFDKILK